VLEFSGQIVFNGLMSGAVYVLIALGFTMIFGIMRVVNFAHGEFYMVAAYVLYLAVSIAGMNYFVGLLLGAAVAGLLGVIVERTLFRLFIGREISGMIIAIAVSLCLRAIALILFGPEELPVPRPIQGSLIIGGIALTYDRVLIGFCAVMIMGCFYLFLHHTKTGLAMRAIAQDEKTATLQGISPTIMYAGAFAVGCVLAGLAGGLMAPIYTVSPTMGEVAMLKAFVVVILGGLGSVPGAVVGGLLLGLVESLFSTLIDSTVATMIVFAMVVVVISWRPYGFFGTRFS
jgi:branched-chain amino acid transport system permease protein